MNSVVEYENSRRVLINACESIVEEYYAKIDHAFKQLHIDLSDLEKEAIKNNLDEIYYEQVFR